MPPDGIVRVIARFDDYKGKYPYHCHILEHEDHEMMRQFETVSCGDGEVDPGEECGETGLAPCQSGLLCVGCLCRARGDCSVDGTAVDLFDVLSQIDLVLGRFTVITSYSIHYTKLYDVDRADRPRLQRLHQTARLGAAGFGLRDRSAVALQQGERQRQAELPA